MQPLAIARVPGKVTENIKNLSRFFLAGSGSL